MTLPQASELAASCAELIDAWHRRRPPLDWEVVTNVLREVDDGWTGMVLDLCLVNCFQWHLEDECRVRYDDPQAVAGLKRAIDESNTRRVQRIDAIDARLADALGLEAKPGESVPVALVTPGNLLDRISILELKRYHVGSQEKVAALLREELDDACSGFDRLVADLVSSRQTLKRYGTVKLYDATDGSRRM